MDAPEQGGSRATTFDVRFEARDFAGNVTSLAITLQTPPATATVLDGGNTLFASTYQGADLVLARGTFLVPDPLTLARLTIAGQAKIVAPQAGDMPVELHVDSLLDLQCQAQVDVSSGGYPGGRPGSQSGQAPEGLVASTVDAGGSHGGTGLAGYYTPGSGGTVGEVYDSVYAPVLGGGGGALKCPNCAGVFNGGDGGGVVEIEAGSLVLDGQILAQGETWELDSSGGAGGSVSIRVGALSGSGQIDASGGDQSDPHSYTLGGSGGGGRVSLVVDTLEAFDPLAQVKAQGGARIDLLADPDEVLGYAAPGTIYVKEAADTYGRLILDSGQATDGTDREGPATELPTLGTGTVTTLEADGSDAWVTAAEAFRPRWVGTWMTLLDAGGADLGAFRVAEVDGAGRVRLEGASAVTGAASYRGQYRFDQVETYHGAGLSAGDPVTSTTVVFEGPTTVAGDVVAEQVVVKSGSVVRPASGDGLRFQVSGTMTVEAGAVLDVSTFGYPGGRPGSQSGKAPEGLVASTVDAGGSHGGTGLAGYYTPGSGGTVGEVYDSVYAPELGGGGGALSCTNCAGVTNGGDGGGVVEIDAGSLVLDGQILAQGETWDLTSSGGAGGSVSIRAGSLSGSGQIDASGGDQSDPHSYTLGGSGGGGRVSLVVDTLEAFDPLAQVKAQGGARIDLLADPDEVLGYAAPGTIYVKEAADTYGRLILDSGQATDGTDREGPATELPTLGTGTVTTLEADGSDAWVTAAEAFRPRWVGTWMTLLDAGGADLGAFRVAEVDGAGRVRLEGASAVTGAASYRGQYRFDQVETYHGAGLSAGDPVTSTTVVFEGPTTVAGDVVAEQVVVKSGSVVRPASGDGLRFQVSGTMTVEAGAVLDVSTFGYPGGRPGSQSGQAPEGLVASTVDAGGSHGGTGLAGYYTPGSGGTVGEVYDSVYAPVLGGGGGALSCTNCAGVTNGGDGGGVVEIDAGSLVLDGQILAQGETWDLTSSGGAGGSVSIRAGSLSGSGQIDASGGDQSDPHSYTLGGSGGGGRVSLVVDTLEAFDPLAQVKAQGGARIDLLADPDEVLGYAAPGTIYVKEATDTYGRLILDSGQAADGTDREGLATELPALGTGAVTSLEVAGSDAWVTAAEAFRPRWVGTWMTLLDAGGADLGAFRVAEVDGAGRVRLEGASAVTGAASYRGQYRFDQVETYHGAGLSAGDPVTSTTVVFEGPTTVAGDVVAEQVVVKSGSVVRPASGDGLRFQVSGTMTVEAGAVLDVSTFGYPGGRPGSLAGKAPEGLVASTVDAGGSHGGAGLAGYYTPGSGGTVGEVYDSVYAPELGGGGGALSCTNCAGITNGGDGGGVVEIDAGSLVLDGQILAQGETWDLTSSGGAGGSVSIRAGSLSGSGQIDASGGDQSDPHSYTLGGSGGGGRVSLVVDTLEAFDPLAQVKAQGGARIDLLADPDEVLGYAAPGTIYVKEATDTYGRLILDSGQAADGTDREGLATELPALGTGAVTSLEVAGSDAWVTAGEAFRPRWVGAWMTLLDANGGELGAYRVAEIDEIGRVRLEGAAAVTGAASYRGEYRFDRVEMFHGAGIDASDSVTQSTLVFGGEVEVPSEVIADSVTIQPGAVVRPLSGSSLHFQVTGALTVGAGARVDVSGLGYVGGAGSTTGAVPGETPPWIAGSTEDAGGSHGGPGAVGYYGAGVPAETYGSVYLPSLPGAGGGSRNGRDDPAGSGGGVVEIEAGQVVLDGELRARGTGPHDNGGAGAGGSVLIHAGSLSGSGTIDASGGHAAPETSTYSIGGAGGGGRVGLWVDSLSGFSPASQVVARGGTRIHTYPDPDVILGYAAPGTIFVKEQTDTYGRLLLDAGEEADGTDRHGAATELPPLGAGAVTSLQAAGADSWITAAEVFLPRWAGARMTLVDAGGADIGTYRVAEIDPAGRARLEGAGAVSVAATYRGEYRFDRIEALHGAGLAASDPVLGSTLVFDGEVAVPAELVADSITITSDSIVRPTSGTVFHLAVSGTLTVETGALLDASGFGYAGGSGSTTSAVSGETPPGVLGSTEDAGGSYGGVGSIDYYGAGVPGEVYGSLYQPNLPGAGGSTRNGHDDPAGSGGGMVEIEAGQVLLDGEIRSRGVSPHDNGGAGAGGSVLIHAGSLSGSGTIDVTGGDAAPETSTYVIGGSGGGGRVGLWVDSLSGFSPASQVIARGGTRIHTYPNPDVILGYAAPGTVFVQTAGSTFGDLYVDQAGRRQLPDPDHQSARDRQGGGQASATVDSTDPTDVWIEDQDSAKLYGLGVVGMWVRLGGVDYPVIDQSADRRQLLLDGAAGAVAAGDEYAGVYKFDTVTVAGDSHLELRDGDEVGAWNIASGSSVTRFDIDPPAVTVTSPAANTLFTAGDPVTITADATDPSGVTSVTFHLGDQSFVDDTAPFEWTAPAPVVETEQDVQIVVEALDGNGNLGSTTQTIRVQPVPPGDPPVVAVVSPTAGLRLPPGFGVDFSVTATQDDGVDRVELLVNDDPTVVATDFDVPYEFHFDVPAGASDGDSYVLHFRARSLGGVYGEATYTVQVIAANVVTADTTISSTDTSFDGSSLVVAAGTLTVEGPHTFRDLVVLDGASVTHPTTTTDEVERLEVTLTRDLYVAAGGAVDATGKGFGAGSTYPGDATSSPFLADDFSDGNLDGWQVVDEGEEGGPSNWAVSGGAVRQTTNIVSNVHQGFGTNLLWSQGLPSGDFRFSALLKSTDDDWLGLVFRYADAGDTYRFVWARQSGFRLIEKVVDGVRTTLAQDSVVYATNTWYHVEVVARGPRVQVWVDGQLVFDIVDSTFATGTVGVFCAANAGTYVDDLEAEPAAGPSAVTAGSHGGVGGHPIGSTFIYGNVFDPSDPGGGGGGLHGGAGGGVVRVDAVGAVVVDGTVRAAGSSASGGPAGAGGSIRLAGASVAGAGSIDASGGSGAAAGEPGGGGGRIALLGASVDDSLVARTLAAGGTADSAEERGSAGTLFVKRDSQALGDLIFDNAGLDSSQESELLAVPPGVVDATDTSSVTDQGADFLHDLAGIDVFFNDDTAALWTVTANAYHGKTLSLDTSVDALTAVPGDTYEGLYRFDHVIVRGGAKALIRSRVQSGSPPDIEAGSSWSQDAEPSLELTTPTEGTVVPAGSTLDVAATLSDAFGVDEAVELELDGAVVEDDSSPYQATFTAPPVSSDTNLDVIARVRDRAGHVLEDRVTILVTTSGSSEPPQVAVVSPSPGARLAPVTGLDFQVMATHPDGVAHVELLGDDDATVLASDDQAPYDFHFDVPVDSVEGDTRVLHFRAQSVGGVYGEATYTLQVIAANVVTADTTIAAADTSLDGSSVVVAAGTLTVEGPHTFRDLVVLNGATVTHPATTVDEVNRLEVGLTRDLFVAPGGAIDADAVGYPAGVAYHEAGTAPFYMADDFNHSGIAGWQIVDEGEEQGPSNWYNYYSSLRQSSNIYSAAEPEKGTYAVWSTPLASGDYRVGFFLRSGDDDGIGMMFRYVDPDNYYRFIWYRQEGYRRLERIENGQITILAEDSVVYSTGVWYLVQIVADGSRLEVWIDGQPIFSVTDSTFSVGTIAAYAYGNTDARFEDVQVTPLDSPSVFPGGSHGGRGGAADGSNPVYDNLFNPVDPGAGGGGLSAAEGGGVVRIAAVGQVVVDGSISARGATSPNLRASSAGGSIRLDGPSIVGLGTIDASGGDGLGLPAAGGGGRIALYGAAIDDGLIARTLAAGGDADSATKRGAAGTIYVKRDTDLLGTLILDDGGLDTDQPTELLPILPGVVDSVTATSLTDDDADFLHDLAGVEVFFNGDTSALWTVTGNASHGQTLDLDTSTQALTAVPGDAYEGLYRFDRVIVRGGAEGLTRSRVDSTNAPEVEPGASWATEYQPSITITSPTAGQVFQSGSTISASATVDDGFGVDSVQFDVGGQISVDATAPYTGSAVAAPVAEATDSQVTVSATDGSGNILEATVTIQIVPDPDAVPPVITPPSCPRDGDLVIAGSAVILDYAVADNEQLYRYAVLVDGQAIREVSDVARASITDSVSWTPPAGTPPGSQFLVQLQGEDYAGNVTTENLVLSTPAGSMLSGDQTLDSTLDGQSVALGPGTFSATEALTLQHLTLLPGATLNTSTSEVALTVSGVLRIQCGASLDVSWQGYRGGYSGHPDGEAPAWVVPSSPDAGGSHGGAGIPFDTTDTAGEVYDSVYEPRLAGGGGALRNTTDTAYESGAGGGVVEITAGSAVVDGEILARGEEGWTYKSAGAGGSVLLKVTGSLSGVGQIDASGWDSGASTTSGREGSGGGGRVALYVGALSGFAPESQVVVQGGQHYYYSTVYGYGAPGTVLVFVQGSSTYGDLIVDAGLATNGAERVGPVTELPALGGGSVTAFEISGADAWMSAASPLPPRWVGAWMVLEDGSGADLGAYQVAAVDEAGRALLLDAGTVASPSTYRGEYRFDRVMLKHGAGLVASDRLQAESVRAEGTSRLPAQLDVTGDVTVASGASVSVAEGDTLQMDVGGTLTVESGASLDVSWQGYRGGYSGHPDGEAPAWVVPSSPDAGGSHGGAGIPFDTTDTAGEVYDSVYEPRLAGGGGALRNTTDTAYESGAGGGVVEITAGSAVVDGEILARGEEGWTYKSAGAGGSVLLKVTGSLSGVGQIDASGWDSGASTTSGREGSGGGGRVALYVGALSGFAPESQVVVQGGQHYYYSTVYGYGAPGTVLVFVQGSSTYGDLIVDAGLATNGAERVGPVTELPALGGGSVTAFEISGADAWMSAASPLPPRWVGAWMVLEDGSGADLGAYQVAAVDEAGRALLLDAGTVASPSTYRGEYRFDRVMLKHGAGLVASDRLQAESVRAEGTSRLPAQLDVTGDVTVASGASVSVAEGDTLQMDVGGTLTVESGASLDVSWQGYRGGYSGHPDGEAPAWVVPSSPDAGGSHGGAGIPFDTTDTAGEVYDSVYEPRLAGGGGALRNTTDTAYESGAGGGVVEITAGSAVVDGEILARGEGGWTYKSAGAGGSVLLKVTGSLSGVGQIDASGWDSGASTTSGREGSGGGGRVALYVGALSGFAPESQVVVQGGQHYYYSTIYGYGAPGTVLVFVQGSSTYGDLIVDSGGTVGFSVPNTVLPTIGTGTVGVAEADSADPTDLWIEPQDSVALFDVGVTGMWVRVDGTDYRVLDQTSDRRRVLLDGAAGLVSVGDAYQGVYKFDTVTVHGGAILELLDTPDVGTYDVDADSQVITPP